MEAAIDEFEIACNIYMDIITKTKYSELPDMFQQYGINLHKQFQLYFNNFKRSMFYGEFTVKHHYEVVVEWHAKQKEIDPKSIYGIFGNKIIHCPLTITISEPEKFIKKHLILGDLFLQYLVTTK